MNQIYEPKEDSFLLKKYVKKYSKNCRLVLDMGTGSGLQAITASKFSNYVLACDINKRAVNYLDKKIKKYKKNNIKVFSSDLFFYLEKNYFNFNKKTFEKSKENNKFDLIIFNPPYLAKERDIKDKSIFGGKKGFEISIRFLEQASEFLSENGKILLISSSLIDQKKIKKTITDHLLKYKIIDSKHYFFEDISIFEISKKKILKKLNKRNISNIKFFSRGKRGVIYIGKYKNKKVGIKIKKQESKAMNTILHEVKFLKILNKKNIGPKLLFHTKKFFVYEFVEGKFILDFIQSSSKKDIFSIINKIFNQCFIMDKLGINKFEMHRPIKHIIVDKNLKPVLIDFERARFSKSPKNVTQFCDFLIGKEVNKLLKGKGIEINKNKIINLARNYKEDINKINFNKILSLIINRH
jgi:HemK-related putative methylase